VPFGLAIAALALGEGGTRWVRRTRRWSLLTWAFLTLGIAFGAWWSYEVLGWGGYWAWDPVENASLLPWLTATAFLHSSVGQSRRGVLQSWNIVLVIATFALTILGTFITRSGIVSSVHSFTQSDVGPILLAFLGAIVVGALALFAARAHLVASEPRIESLMSREGAFLVNNLLLSLFTFVVLVGTMYPVVIEALTGDQLSVGRPFFDRMAIPISLALLLAMGIGPLLPYRVAAGRLVRERLRLPAVAGLAAGAVLVVAGVRVPAVVVTTILVTGVLAAIGQQLASAVRRRPSSSGRAVLEVLRGNPGYWGGQISHAGVALVALAIAASGGLADRATVTLDGEREAAFAGYELEFREIARWQEPNRAVTAAVIDVRRDGRQLRTLMPRVNEYEGQAQPIGTPAVRTGLTEDLYISVAAMGTDEVTVNLHRYPLQWVLWAGALIVAAGAFWALTGRRRPRDERALARPSQPPRPVVEEEEVSARA
jgi:cytochrome c-type biogenesis protein CcmF